MKTLKQLILVYQLLFWMLIPFVVCLIPVIPTILFNEYYMLLLIISMPLGFLVFDLSINKISEL